MAHPKGNDDNNDTGNDGGSDLAPNTVDAAAGYGAPLPPAGATHDIPSPAATAAQAAEAAAEAAQPWPQTAPPRAPAATDPTLARYLDALQLDELDLSHLPLEPEQHPAMSLGPVTFGAALLAGLGVLLWLPSTALYQLHALGEPLWWATLTLTLGLLTWGGYAYRAASAAGRGGLFGLPWAQLQPLLLILAAGLLVAALVWLLPQEAEWQGSSYSLAWFVATAAALASGVLVGRFILLQAAASPLVEDLPPWRPPPWLRWVSLGLLLTGAAVVLVGPSLWGGEGSHGQDFSLAGISLAVGVFGAIWLVRRFDEWEARWREEAMRKAAPAPVPFVGAQLPVSRDEDDAAGRVPRQTGSAPDAEVLPRFPANRQVTGRMGSTQGFPEDDLDS